ncbi:MAG: polyprenol phosphomannose-dependent alpha 1,6 mannosyltransferase MptB, partial [Sciscionella sp.]
LGTGLGFGWINALGVPGVVRSWISPMTAIGFLAGGLGLLLGLGNHAEAAVDAMRVFGTAVTGVVCVKLLLDTYRHRVEPLFGLGLCLAAVVAFGATVQPWYLLWAVPLLAAAARPTRLRTAVTVISAIFSLLVPPTGSTFDGHVYVVPEAYFAAIVILAAAMYVVRHRIPILPVRLPSSSDEDASQAGLSAAGTEPDVVDADSGRADNSDNSLPSGSR